MKKQDEYKIGAAAKDFIEKYKPELSHIKKAELEAMLREFAIQQVKNNVALADVSQQRELLEGFVDWFNINDKTQAILNERIEEYLKTL